MHTNETPKTKIILSEHYLPVRNLPNHKQAKWYVLAWVDSSTGNSSGKETVICVISGLLFHENLCMLTSTNEINDVINFLF